MSEIKKNDPALQLNRIHSQNLALSSSVIKRISSMLNKDKLFNFTKFIENYSIINKKDIKCFKKYLKDISNDLISKVHKKQGITEYLFSKYYELPGLISERLYTVFCNNEKEEFLDGENFIKKMLELFSGNFTKLSNIIFDLIDFDNDGKISYDGTRIILSHIPITHNRYDQNKFRFEQDEYIDRINSQEEISNSLDILFNNKKSLTLNEFIDIVKNVNSNIFIFLLLFILDRKPFSKETLQIYSKEDSNSDDDSDDDSDDEEEEENSNENNCIYIISPSIKDKKFFTPSIPKIIDKFGVEKMDLYNVNTIPEINNENKNLRSHSEKKLSMLNKKHKENNNNKIKNKNEIKPISSTVFNVLSPGDSNNICKVCKKGSLHMVTNIKFKFSPVERNLKKNYDKDKINNDIENSKENKKSDSDKEKSSDSSDSKSSKSIDKKEEKSTNIKNNNICVVNDNSNKNSSKILNEGYLYKYSDSGKFKKYWCKLINKDLFLFKKKDSKHIEMFSLIRTFVKESYSREIDDEDYYCFQLIFENKEKEFFVEDEDEYLSWINILKKILYCENINDNYTVKEKLGEGRYASVYKGIHKLSGRLVSIKIINKNNITKLKYDMIQNEIEISKICQHPNIVKLYDVIEDMEKIYLIFEYCSGTDLLQYFEQRNYKIPEPEIAKIIHKLSLAIFYIEAFGIIHRDIKPENILLTNNTENYDIKLADFGLAMILGPNEKSTQPFGTVSYVAPEVLKSVPYDKSVDIWGIGILSYLLLFGKLPFDDPDEDENEISRQTINDPVVFSEKKSEEISKEAKDFIISCLKKNPEERINITQILQHEWFKKYVSNELIEHRKECQSKKHCFFDIFEVFSSGEF